MPEITSTEEIKPGELYTVQETASFLKYSDDYIRDLFRSGRIKGSKPNGGHIRIQGSEIQRLLGSVNAGAGLPAKPEVNDVAEIEVSPETAGKILPEHSQTEEHPAESEHQGLRIGRAFLAGDNN